jgi:hypothetical protein
MQRFKVGDVVLILPRFAHLYPKNSGVVSAVKRDPFRSMFNEYIAAFDDGSSASIFEFQLVEDGLEYRNLIAELVFDSHQQEDGARSQIVAAERLIILQTETVDIDLRMQSDNVLIMIAGQILERRPFQPAASAEISLRRDNVLLATTISDNLGAFKLSTVLKGPYYIQALIPSKAWRITGMFAI